MAARSSWKGFLKFSLVSIPIKGYSTGTSAGTVRLHQLHAKCHRRIKYKKVCPIHGEVDKDDIVSGHEYSKGHYAVIEPDELAALRAAGDRAIHLDAVVPAHFVDPIYLTEKSYYLVPDGAAGQKPFVLLQKSLAARELTALGRAVLFGQPELVVLRPMETLLVVTVLRYENEVRQPRTVADQVDSPRLSAEEIELTETLVKAFARKKVSLGDFRDEYVDRLRDFIDAKVEGKDTVAPPQAEQPRVINLMDALKRSVAETGKLAGAKKQPRSKVGPVAQRRGRGARARRKSG